MLSRLIQQLFTVGIHELCHLAVGLLCGGQVVSICIDPNDGGATHVLGLMRDYPRVMHDPYAMPTFTQLFWSPSAVATLAAGYVGSAVVGSVLVVSTFQGDEIEADLQFCSCRSYLYLSNNRVLTSSPHCRFQGLRSSTALWHARTGAQSGSLDVSRLSESFS
jgi:hypothetical protein